MSIGLVATIAFFGGFGYGALLTVILIFYPEVKTLFERMEKDDSR